MNKYLQLFRTGNAVMGIVGVAVAAFMAAGTDIADAWANLLISAVVVFMFICGGNALNDYIDYEIDKTAHPERPIPSGRMTRRAALHAALAMLGGSVVVSLFTFDLECILIVVIACVLMVSYEVALKQRGFVGNVTIAVLTGMMFLLGGAVVGDAADNVIVALMALLVSDKNVVNNEAVEQAQLNTADAHLRSKHGRKLPGHARAYETLHRRDMQKHNNKCIQTYQSPYHNVHYVLENSQCSLR